MYKTKLKAIFFRTNCTVIIRIQYFMKHSWLQASVWICWLRLRNGKFSLPTRTAPQAPLLPQGREREHFTGVGEQLHDDVTPLPEILDLVQLSDLGHSHRLLGDQAPVELSLPSNDKRDIHLFAIRPDLSVDIILRLRCETFLNRCANKLVINLFCYSEQQNSRVTILYSRNQCELVPEVASRLPGSCTQLAHLLPLSWSDQI